LLPSGIGYGLSPAGYRGTGWCLDVAYAAAPGAPWAWDMRIVADAAFARYVREAADFAGGRRLEPGG